MHGRKPRLALAALGLLVGPLAAAEHPLLEEAAALVSSRLEATRALDGGDLHAKAARLVAALRSEGRVAPPWLTLMARRPERTAVFAMACFWTGEARLGQLEGVAASRTGWLGGQEVVELSYDPAQVEYAQLVDAAMRRDCARAVFTRTPDQQRVAAAKVGGRARRNDRSISATPGDDRYHSRRAPWRFLPMVPAQATRVNAAVALGEDARVFLSPRQRQLLEAIRRRPDAGWPDVRHGGDFVKAWARAQALASPR